MPTLPKQAVAKGVRRRKAGIAVGRPVPTTKKRKKLRTRL